MQVWSVAAIYQHCVLCILMCGAAAVPDIQIQVIVENRLKLQTNIREV